MKEKYKLIHQVKQACLDKGKKKISMLLPWGRESK